MTDLNALVVFAKVAETQSFSEAARRLEIPVSTVSRKIVSLEDQLGVRLIERSTRRLRLTELGLEILAEAQRSAEIQDAVHRIVSNEEANVTGLLRLSAPPSISDSFLVPIINAFAACYPSVRLHVLVTDRFVDHIAEGVDLVFRVGALRDSALVAQTLLTYRRRLVASPDYLSSHGTPGHPEALPTHRLIAFASAPTEKVWTFERNSVPAQVRFQPFLAMNDYTGIAAALAAGVGIGDLPPIVQPQLMLSGRLVEVLPEWKLPNEPLSMVHLGNRHIRKALRLFKAFAVEMAPKLFPDLPT